MDFSPTPPAFYSYFCFYCLRIGLWGCWGGDTQMVFHCREAVLLYWVTLFTQCPRNLWLASVYINATSYLWGFQVTKLLLLLWSCDCVCFFPFFLSVPPTLSLSLFAPSPLFSFSPFLPSYYHWCRSFKNTGAFWEQSSSTELRVGEGIEKNHLKFCPGTQSGRYRGKGCQLV